MIRRVFAAAIVCGIGASSLLVAAEGTCWVVAIATNQDEKHSEEWNQYGQEFALVFRDHAKPLYKSVKVATVLGRQARLPQMSAAMRHVAANAGPRDFVAIYVGCHGGTDGRDGWGIDTMDGQVVWARDFKGVAAQLKCPVLFVIDTCGSGGFVREHPRDPPLPPNCVAICSSRAKQSTTNNLNIALHEALWGHGDANSDSFVDIEETARYVQQRVRKIAPTAGLKLKDQETPVVVVGDNVPSTTKLTQVSGQVVAVLQDREWYLARLIGEEGETCKLHALGYQDNPSLGFFVLNEAPKDHVFKLENGMQPALVKNNNQNRPALFLGMEGDQGKVRFVAGRRKTTELVDKANLTLPFAHRSILN